MIGLLYIEAFLQFLISLNKLHVIVTFIYVVEKIMNVSYVRHLWKMSHILHLLNGKVPTGTIILESQGILFFIN